MQPPRWSMQPRCTVPIGIPVENGNHSFMGKISQRKILEWKDIKYLMIDEVSMIDSKVMQRLNSQLSKIKSSDEKFGGVSIIFLGDFLQLPSVSHYDYTSIVPNGSWATISGDPKMPW